MSVQLETRSKLCKSCEEVKPYVKFSKRSDRPDGLQTSCKDCQKARPRTWARKPEELKGEIELTEEQKSGMYQDVIFRMQAIGIMSDKTAQEALKRVINHQR